ncbi:MAG: hypothetical protein Q8O40_12625, partial [Chloroflexota bacterium]|nr:hypothetical protein [Chloroflexota bacterium]
RMRKTRLMEEVEQRHGRPLELLLPEVFNREGLVRTAKALGVSKSAVEYWMLKLRLTQVRVVLSPGDVAVIHGPNGSSPLE